MISYKGLYDFLFWTSIIIEIRVDQLQLSNQLNSLGH